MRCCFCDKPIRKIRPISLLKEDLLCPVCREVLKGKLRIQKMEGISVFYLYTYDDAFSSLLLQYKEAYDEALKDVFLYPYEEILSFLFRRYRIVYVPSSSLKLERRGFHHLKEIFVPLLPREFCPVFMKEEMIQEGKERRERAKMKENYYIKKKVLKKDRILIVDDVMTTGSSIMGVYRLFRPYTKHICVFCLAITKEKKGLSKIKE